ncbi:MAG: hypothetical protein JXR63_05085 [Spirochaetales bacterium]|nr:hypothetical protein [Spirochaetales bacterium]
MKVKYLIIGGVSFIIQGLTNTTKEIDLYVAGDEENLERIIYAFSQLGIISETNITKENLKNKDFFRILTPIKINLFFKLHGFSSFDKTLDYRNRINGFNVLSIEGSIISYSQIHTMRSRYILQILKDYQFYLKKGLQSANFYENTFLVPDGYHITDIQTIHRWESNQRRPVRSRLSDGIKSKALPLEKVPIA